MNIKEFGNLANKSVAFSGRFKLKNLRILVAAHCRQVIQHPSFFHKADLLVEGKRVNQNVRQLLENGHPSVDEAGILSLAGLLDTSRDRIEPLPQCFQRYACALALNMTNCSPYHSLKVPQLDLSYFNPHSMMAVIYLGRRMVPHSARSIFVNKTTTRTRAPISVLKMALKLMAKKSKRSFGMIRPWDRRSTSLLDGK